jgi:hypothetical protein
MKKIILAVLLISVLLFCDCVKAEDINLLSYYPSPTGVYQQLEVLRQDDTDSILRISSYSNALTVTPRLTFRKADGTAEAPTNIHKGDIIGMINFAGMHSIGSFLNTKRIVCIASKTWIDENPGTGMRHNDDADIIFQSIDSNNNGAVIDLLTITNEGRLYLNETSRIGIGVDKAAGMKHIIGFKATGGDIGVEQPTNTSFSGGQMVVSAGDAPINSTDKNGGDLYLQSGEATGTGSSTIRFWTSVGKTTGTNLNLISERMIIDKNVKANGVDCAIINDYSTQTYSGGGKFWSGAYYYSSQPGGGGGWSGDPSVNAGGAAGGIFTGGDGGSTYGGGGAGIVAIGGNRSSDQAGGGAGIYAKAGTSGANCDFKSPAGYFDGNGSQAIIATTNPGSASNHPERSVATFINTNIGDKAHVINAVIGYEDTPQNNIRTLEFLSCYRGNNIGAGCWAGSIIDCAGQIAIIGPSDMRLKANIHSASFGIDDISKIKVREFNWKDDEAKKTRVGFIAQELYEVYPDAVRVGGDDPKKEPWAVSQEMLIPLMVKSIQDLKVENDKLKIEIDTLKKEVAELKK